MVPRKDSMISASSPDILVADELRKSYGKRIALHGLSFTLKAGRVMGFLGPNGAGKTTAIRILTTILEADSGYFFVDGISSEFPEKIRGRIGVLPESLGFPKQITAIDFLVYFGQLYGQSAGYAKSNAVTLLEEVGLKQRAKSLLGTYSRGMRQRLGVARALINSPSVVFLDEPTLGLDPRGQQELLELVRRIASDRNAGVILCSHMLTEIESVCDDVVILNLGQIVARGTVADVIGRVEKNILLKNSIKIRIPSMDVVRAHQILEDLESVKKVSAIGEMEGWLEVELVDVVHGDTSKTYQITNMILAGLIREKIFILNFDTGSGRLQDVFLHLTEEVIE